MEEERWQKIEKIINQALKLENIQQRNAYIREACQDDLDLYKEVSNLLEAIYQAKQSGFLE